MLETAGGVDKRRVAVDDNVAGVDDVDVDVELVLVEEVDVDDVDVDEVADVETGTAVEPRRAALDVDVAILVDVAVDDAVDDDVDVDDDVAVVVDVVDVLVVVDVEDCAAVVVGGGVSGVIESESAKKKLMRNNISTKKILKSIENKPGTNASR